MRMEIEKNAHINCTQNARTGNVHIRLENASEKSQNSHQNCVIRGAWITRKHLIRIESPRLISEAIDFR